MFVGQEGVGGCREEGGDGGTSGQICSPIIPDSSDALGLVRQSERGVVNAIRSAHLTSFVRVFYLLI